MSYSYSIDGDKIPDGKAYNVDGDLVAVDVDYNYPKPTTMVTHVDLNNSDALYIYVENKSKFPPQKFHQYIQRIAEQFKIAFPDRTIIVGMDDLKFTVISKKQEFKAKLDGTL